MATRNVPKGDTPEQQGAARAVDQQVKDLQEAVRSMDASAQRGFGEIASIAMAAAALLETPHGQRNPSDLANLFQTIHALAEEVENQINSEAEKFGCDYVDPAWQRRSDAQARTFAEAGA